MHDPQPHLSFILVLRLSCIIGLRPLCLTVAGSSLLIAGRFEEEIYMLLSERHSSWTAGEWLSTNIILASPSPVSVSSGSYMSHLLSVGIAE